MSQNVPEPEVEDSSPWYTGITRYQWVVLAIASAGWAFDIYEGQIFNITRADMFKELLADRPAEEFDDLSKFYGDVFLAIFLAGGTLGGLLFGSLADRMGRRPVMVLTILMYSVFAGLTYFAQNLWQVGLLRFLVAMGIGGEWAVAASLVAEVFPKKARAHASGIFHATSVLGTWMAAIAGLIVGTNWRYAYLVGVLPALLIVWVRASLKEPERWEETTESPVEEKRGSFKDLLTNARWARRALLGMCLAAVGLGTFWAVVVAGQDLTKKLILRTLETSETNAADGSNAVAATPPDESPKSSGSLFYAESAADAPRLGKFAYGIVQTAGGGLGLLMFGPLCARFGRRKTFIFYHLVAFVMVPIVCYVPASYVQMLLLLPIFGFFTLGIHAGYAIYFPELFPTHLRATGASFCFNGGRVLAVPILLLSGFLKSTYNEHFGAVVVGLGGLFLLGACLMLFLPETKGQDLPEA